MLPAKRWLGFAVRGLLPALAAGCQTARPLPVLVRDAETHAPVADAEVRLWYPLRKDLRAVTATTGGDGTVRLAAVRDEDAGPIVEARARGYLLCEHSVPLDTVRTLKPGAGAAPDPYVVELLAEPRPYYELVVPTGYRGKVTVRVHVREDAAGVPGQRCFSVTVPRDGVARVEGPPLLRLVSPGDCQAKYADGTPIGTHAEPDAVGLYWLRSEGDDQVFVVDTRRDFEAMRDDSKPERTRPASGGQGGGRGGGRGHRRGGAGAGAGSP